MLSFGTEQRYGLCRRRSAREAKEAMNKGRRARCEQRRAVALAKVLDAVKGGREEVRLLKEGSLREQLEELAVHVLGVHGESLPVTRE